MKTLQRAVFLDRDGVINRAIIYEGRPYPPKSLAQLEILPGVEEALKELHIANYLLIVITNQPDVTRGKTKKKSIEKINEYLLSKLPIDLIKTCYHDDKDNCNCRKPKPGAILEAASKYKINLFQSYMIGDRWKDIEAGKLAECKTILINNEYNEINISKPDYIVKTLMEAKNIIIGNSL